ncbi:MAG: hypothetical protein IJQ89_00885 [Bacteroidales bacterium]|nr:hypothetical protein [Bacteroidales bacterium]
MKIKDILSFVLLFVTGIGCAISQQVETPPVSVAGTYTATAVRGRLEIHSPALTLTADSLAKDAPTTFYAYSVHAGQLPPVPSTLKVVTGGKCHGYCLCLKQICLKILQVKQ